MILGYTLMANSQVHPLQDFSNDKVMVIAHRENRQYSSKSLSIPSSCRHFYLDLFRFDFHVEKYGEGNSYCNLYLDIFGPQDTALIISIARNTRAANDRIAFL